VKRLLFVFIIIFIVSNTFAVITHSQLDEAKVLEKGESKHAVVFGQVFNLFSTGYGFGFLSDIYHEEQKQLGVLQRERDYGYLINVGFFIPTTTCGYSHKVGLSNKSELSFELMSKSPAINLYFNEEGEFHYWVISDFGFSTDIGIKKQLYNKKDSFISYKINFGFDTHISETLNIPIVLKNSLLIGYLKKNKLYNFIPYVQSSVFIEPLYVFGIRVFSAEVSQGYEYMLSNMKTNNNIFNVGSFVEHTFYYKYFNDLRGVFRESETYVHMIKAGISFSFTKLVNNKKE